MNRKTRPLKLTILLFVILTLTFNSCNEPCVKGSGNIARIERNVSSFNKVKLKGSFNLYIRQGPVQKVELVADDNILPLIRTDISGETLVVGFRHHACIRKSHRSDVYITLPSLTGISLDGSGNVYGENIFSGNVDLSIKGSGGIGFSFDGNSLTGSIDGSGNINLLGRADYAGYRISGSGNIHASGLNVAGADAGISGSGKMELSVRDRLNVVISGSGEVIYYGDPSTQVSVSGSGKVTKR